MKNSAWSDEDDEDDDALDDDLNADDTTQPCPNCGRQIYDDAEQCPHCGHYITEEEASRTNKPWWIIAGFVLCFAIVLYWLFA